jgi:hypothetical protein
MKYDVYLNFRFGSIEAETEDEAIETAFDLLEIGEWAGDSTEPGMFLHHLECRPHGQGFCELCNLDMEIYTHADDCPVPKDKGASWLHRIARGEDA